LIFIFSKATNYGSNFQAQFAEKNRQQANALGKHMENYSNKYLPARIELKEQKQKQDPGIERDDTQLRGERRELQLNLKKNDNGSTNKLQPTCCMLHAANST